MIKTELGMVKAEGSKAVLLTDLSMIVYALHQEFSEEEIQESVNIGLEEHEENKAQEDDKEKRRQIAKEILNEIFGTDGE